MKFKRKNIKEIVISNNKKLSEDEKRKVYCKCDSSIIYEFFIFRKENITKEIGKKYFFIENNNIIMSIAFEEKLEKYKEYCEECGIKTECKLESEDYCIANWVNFKKIAFIEFLILEGEKSKVSEEFLEKYKEELGEAEEEKYFILVEK